MSIIAPDRVQEAFLAAPPLIAQAILDLSVKAPNWLADVGAMEQWPLGNGTVIEQIIFKGSRPQIERGFALWRTMGNNTGCQDGPGTDCAYNFATTFGGYGFERKRAELMSRDFRTDDYCISEIQTSAQFQDVFAKIIENIFAQTQWFKQFNIMQNAYVSLSKKFVIDSDGIKPNPGNIYNYRAIGSAELSKLNIDTLIQFYEVMRRAPDAIPYDVVDGSPIYALEASAQTLAELYRDDPENRKDVRFSGLANDLLMKYNFMSTIRNMFVAAPILYPRRFNNIAGSLVEVSPWINGVPGEVGEYTDVNPEWLQAEYEEVNIHGRDPFKIYWMPTQESLGSNTSFGPDPGFMDTW